MTTRKQHYVPQFYLKRFEDNTGRLTVENIHTNNYSKMLTRNVCFEKDMYEIKDDNGKKYKENYLEKMFSNFQSYISYNFDKLICRIQEYKNIKDFRLTGEEDTIIALFITLQLIRHPTFKRFVYQSLDNSNIANVSEMEKGLFYVMLNFTDETFEEVMIDIFPDIEPAKLPKGNKNLLSEICSYLVSNCYFSLVVPKSEDTCFLTSDNIIVKSPSRDIKYYFPLTKKIGVIVCEFSELSHS
ncbi:DUF4238 domain-containing protein [Clostridium paridis]|uniref:DUF4238 domain-containing protein n=1 Tax=Clostridium paridis TaxID=2803863 RepID=A0A937FFG0_9CLOT|nr:DUF4238 domain-containing protein [Clostridium paridis]MBL4930907.1 DUF4238 domain-containing protein [Clostridium paridis]